MDVSASYPTGECTFNVSKATTRTEMIEIEGVDIDMGRLQGINLSGGGTNAVEFCTEMFGMPDMLTMLSAFETQMGLPISTPVITHFTPTRFINNDFFVEPEIDVDVPAPLDL